MPPSSGFVPSKWKFELMSFMFQRHFHPRLLCFFIFITCVAFVMTIILLTIVPSFIYPITRLWIIIPLFWHGRTYLVCVLTIFLSTLVLFSSALLSFSYYFLDLESFFRDANVGLFVNAWSSFTHQICFQLLFLN